MLMRRAEPAGGNAPPPRARAAGTLAVAAAGYVLHYWTWMLIGPIGPQLAHRYGLDAATWALLGIAPLLVGVLVRIPAGVLADRLGARIVLPAVSLAAALAVLALAAVDGLPALVAVACVIGVAGAALPAGAAAVVRAVPPGRRGTALSVFAAGMCLAAAAGVAARAVLRVERESGLLVLAGVLLAYALLAVAVLRDGPGPKRRPAEAWSAVTALLRRPVTRHLAVWYGVSCGGIVAVDLYLPAYLHRTYGIDWTPAMLAAAAGMGVAAAAGTFGGWLCQHRAPTTVIGTCFTTLAALLLVLAFDPPLVWVATPALAGVAVALGTAFGSVLALIGRTAPPAQAGTITGVIGAIGSAVGLFPTLLLTAVRDGDGSYAMGLILLASAAIVGARSLRARRGWIGAAVAFPAPAVVASQSATTVVSLAAPQIRAYLGDITAVLAALATRHELAVVCADPAPSGRAGIGLPLVAGLRQHLPKHTILSIVAETPPHPHETAAIAAMIDAGTIPVILVSGADPTPTAMLLAAAVDADQVLHLTHDRVEGLIPVQRLPEADYTAIDAAR
ncbi:MFS transporter [Dactylosporangium siamense]|uniref:MFS transporter n=1 Tax=Dactylosporangium siamense TaxID=685454 RepID=UPI0019430548|nr:MFS transporter [Dactylosporangium siamense]